MIFGKNWASKKNDIDACYYIASQNKSITSTSTV